ncbi:cysteine proteinase [Coemansia reversa NRRL 1564]|uniref:Cysteine proteinase n=1 Tax=Coemansia reversa (strain ATCC 12441 / NRRL 1564) TaxID=763665 RepID=A0A2G5B916_COERN|nr:cysteine proteinase [Coemansia reversa NRRL 1564]|eukprot:PIA15480.1 cysteine proteinase [Coemansia reversa NRRL 1564]
MTTDAIVLDFENAEVRSSDFESLKPEGWLTGEIINFYWTFLERREFRTEPSVLFLGTYTAYRIANAESAIVTDNISIQLSDELSQREVILIPLNHKSHWSLLVYCRLTRTFYHYDSISKHNRNFAERAAGRFLRVLETKSKEGFYFKSMQTPQQNNDYDCGIYVLTIAEELARRFINNKRKSISKKEIKSVSSTRRDQRFSDKLPTQRKNDTYNRHSAARDFTEDVIRNRTITPAMSAAHIQQQSHSQPPPQRRNHSTPPISRVPVSANIPTSPGRALASDLLMPKFRKPFSVFHSPFVAMTRTNTSEFYTPEQILKGGGSNTCEELVGGANSKGSSRLREERLKMEEIMLEKAGLPRDFWLVTVEDIEYPHCMRRRMRSLILDLQRQQTHKSWSTRV